MKGIGDESDDIHVHYIFIPYLTLDECTLDKWKYYIIKLHTNVWHYFPLYM